MAECQHSTEVLWHQRLSRKRRTGKLCPDYFLFPSQPRKGQDNLLGSFPGSLLIVPRQNLGNVKITHVHSSLSSTQHELQLVRINQQENYLCSQSQHHSSAQKRGGLNSSRSEAQSLLSQTQKSSCSSWSQYNLVIYTKTGTYSVYTLPGNLATKLQQVSADHESNSFFFFAESQILDEKWGKYSIGQQIAQREPP